MANNFGSVSKKIQDLMTLYAHQTDDASKINDALLEQEWLRQRQK
ncbi:MAG: hypothetical protein R8M37_02135 [Alphaproteobacteria bacterium]|nr:hypothetical protein [Alphaproteobacteria bacterium]